MITVWWRLPRVTLVTSDGRLTIDLLAYSRPKRRELVAHLRDSFSGSEQSGWDQVVFTRITEAIDVAGEWAVHRRRMLFLVAFFGLITPFLYAALIWLKRAEGMPTWSWAGVVLFPPCIAGFFIGTFRVIGRVPIEWYREDELETSDLETCDHGQLTHGSGQPRHGEDAPAEINPYEPPRSIRERDH